MTDNNEQQQIQGEISYQTISEFLESNPPNQQVSISDLADWVDTAHYAGKAKRAENTGDSTILFLLLL